MDNPELAEELKRKIVSALNGIAEEPSLGSENEIGGNEA